MNSGRLSLQAAKYVVAAVPPCRILLEHCALLPFCGKLAGGLLGVGYTGSVVLEGGRVRTAGPVLCSGFARHVLCQVQGQKRLCLLRVDQPGVTHYYPGETPFVGAFALKADLPESQVTVLPLTNQLTVYRKEQQKLILSYLARAI
jgi:hypothetical protein